MSSMKLSSDSSNSSYHQVNWFHQKTLSYTSAITEGKTIPNTGKYKYIPWTLCSLGFANVIGKFKGM